MSKIEMDYTAIPYPKLRKATIGVLKAARRKNMIHSFVEFNIENARRNLRLLRKETKNYISLTGYIICCVAREIENNQIMHAYRNRKNQLVLFDDVDVSTTIERKIDKNSEVVAKIIRKANRKTLSQVSLEIKEEKEKNVKDAEVFRSVNLFLAIPSFIRQLVFRLLDRSPKFMKKRAGTIMVTSANMIGGGAAWGLPIATHTCNVTIGGIVERVVEQNGRFVKKQHLCLTFSFDHDIIDGAPAARFIRRLKQSIENGEVKIYDD